MLIIICDTKDSIFDKNLPKAHSGSDQIMVGKEGMSECSFSFTKMLQGVHNVANSVHTVFLEAMRS